MFYINSGEKRTFVERLRRSPRTGWNNLVRFGRKSTEEKTTEERKERRFRAVSLFVLFHSSAFVFELFRLLFIKCVNALLFSPTRNKRREVEEREVCFENNNNRERERRERERESASAFLVGALSPRSALFELFLPSSSSRLFSPQNKLVDTTER